MPKASAPAVIASRSTTRQAPLPSPRFTWRRPPPAFPFPGRPGRFLRFPPLLPPGGNISLFHYRNRGADYGRILVGLQVPGKTAADRKAFKDFLEALAYPCVEESSNPVYQLFLR